MSDPDDFDQVEEDDRAWTVAALLILLWGCVLSLFIGWGIWKLASYLAS